MSSRVDFDRGLPVDDQGPFEDLDRIRIAMLNEPPPPPGESLFAGERLFGTPVLDNLRFFRWILHDLYGGNVWLWESTLERRDERLQVIRPDGRQEG
jgi:hypothetical protein